MNSSISPKQDSRSRVVVTDHAFTPLSAFATSSSFVQDQDDSSSPRPRRPMTAYNYFFRAERNRMRDSECQGVAKPAFGEATKAVAKKWKLLSPTEKQEYEALAQQDKQRYDNEMKEWKQRQIDVETRAILGQMQPFGASSKLPYVGCSPASFTLTGALGQQYDPVMPDTMPHISHRILQSVQLEHPRPLNEIIRGALDEDVFAGECNAARSCRNNVASLRRLARSIDKDLLDEFIGAFKPQ